MAGKVLFTIIACSLSVAVFAQVDNSKEDKNVRRTIPIKMLDEPTVIDQRDVKHWANGQKSTPTGRQATGIGSGYSALRKDEPVKIINPASSLTASKRSIPENRKNYKWENGQTATITGYQATGIGSGYASLKKDKNVRDAIVTPGNTRKRDSNSANIPSNRKIKLWPDGQKATVTGHEAAPINGGYSSLGKKKNDENKK